ncbi:hypothetical protein LTR85_002117 [Meristemomyces frigidus]|nr:hypothetical protein LTR85_002117 [Meristemomyces frigidus]
MSILPGVQVAELAFAPLGAACGFIAFQLFIGNLLARNIYKAFAEDDDVGFRASTRTVGIAYSMSYVAQSSIAVLGGGYATGTAEAITHESKAGNAAIVTVMAAIWLWAKMFSDSPWLTWVWVLLVDNGQKILSLGKDRQSNDD